MKLLSMSLVSLALITTIKADFVVNTMNNSGTMAIDRIQVKHNLNNTGTIKNSNELFITCETLEGDGLIQSPVIIIVAENIAFTGTIACEKECVIFTKTPQESCLFKQSGSGVIIFKEFVNNVLINDIIREHQKTISHPDATPIERTSDNCSVSKKQENVDAPKELEPLWSVYNQFKAYIQENGKELILPVSIVAITLGLRYYLQRR